MQNHITFEHPLNERMRTFLRADHLFQLAHHRFADSQDPWNARDCIATIIELHNLIDRTEFRSELFKEIERHINNLQRLAKTPNVDHQALNKILQKLQAAGDDVRDYFDNQQVNLKEHDLFNSIRQRLNIPGGACSFDLPAFHYWLHLPVKVRQQDLKNWFSQITPLDNALTLVLDLIRESSMPTHESSEKGSFQKSLHTQMNAQLVQVTLDANLGVYPEISGNKHRINIRFMQANFELGKPQLCTEPFDFLFNCCII